MAAQFMKAPYQTFKTLPSKQKGAVLLVSVVTLSLLALAGLSTVEQTVVQERTSVNSKAADDATRNAEKGLKQAVADLTNGDVFTNGFCTENLSTEDPANWECEKVSEDGYTYVVSYIMNGDQPATDDNGDTIYKVSVVGVRSGSSGGSLATQSLTAGVVVRNVATAGVWDDAIVGCRNVTINRASVEGDVRNTNAIASMVLTNEGDGGRETNDGSVEGSVFYTDSSGYDKASSFFISGDESLADQSECDPLGVSGLFALHLAIFEDNDGSHGNYSQPTGAGRNQNNRSDDSISSGDYYYDNFVFRDKKLTFEGNVNIYVQNDFDISDANVDLNNATDVVNIYVGSRQNRSGELDGEVVLDKVKFGVKGIVNIYVADNLEMDSSEINFQGTSPQFNIFAGSPRGSDFHGNVQIKESFFTGGGSGRASEEFVTIFGLFGDNTLAERTGSDACNGEHDGNMAVKDTPNGKTFGGRLYAPRAHICVHDAQFRGSIRGYDVILRDDDTRFVYSVAEELQGSDSDSEVSAYSLLFYTRGDVDFVAGGETACEQTGVAGSSSSSTSGGSGEASVNCDAIDDSSSEENSESAVSEQSPPVEESEVSEEAPASEESEVSEEAPASEESEVSGGSSGGEESEASEEAPASEESEVSEESEESSTSNYPDGYADLPQACQDSYNSGTQKITICHVQGGGKKRTSNTLEISVNGWNGHSNHNDDYCGPCN